MRFVDVASRPRARDKTNPLAHSSCYFYHGFRMAERTPARAGSCMHPARRSDVRHGPICAPCLRERDGAGQAKEGAREGNIEAADGTRRSYKSPQFDGL